MSIALGALLLVLLLLPGIAFRYAYVRSNSIRRSLDFSLLSEAVTMVVISLLLHGLGIYLSSWLEREPDFRLLYLLITGGDLAEVDFQLIVRHYPAFIGYIFWLCLTAALIGFLLQQLVIRFGLDGRYKVLRVFNDWDRYFSGWVLPSEQRRQLAFTRIDVLVEGSSGNPIMYSGILENYSLNKDQTIAQLFISSAIRKEQLKWQEESGRSVFTKSSSRSYEILGAFLVIPFSEVRNLNIIYTTLPDQPYRPGRLLRLYLDLRERLARITQYTPRATTGLLAGLLLCTCGPAPDDAEPQDSPVTLTRDSLSLTVDPTYGGRIVSLTYGDKELLNTVRDSSGFTYGSTAWPSPQADWGWPPPTAIDRGPYEVQRVEEHSVTMISQPAENGLVLQKRFRLGPDSDVGLTYWLTNRGDSTLSVAAWEVTRLPYGGRIEFMADSIRSDREGATVETRDSIFRTVHFDERHQQPTKVFANLDSVPVSYYHDGLVLRKETIVTDFYRVAPGQAPLEVYLDPPRQFAEFELQGDYRQLGYGETTTLRIRWIVEPY